MVLFLREHLLSREIRKRFRAAKVLFVPISSFDTELESALYTLRLTFLTDYAAAVERTRRWIDDLGRRTEPISFVSKGPCSSGGPGTNFVCALADDLTLDAWASPTIGAGQWVGVGSYCELAVTGRGPAANRPHPFTIDGTAVASGVLAARDPRFDDAGDARIRAANDLRRELARRAPIVLRLKGGVLAEARADGEDFTDALREATNPEYGCTRSNSASGPTSTSCRMWTGRSTRSSTRGRGRCTSVSATASPARTWISWSRKRPITSARPPDGRHRRR